MAVDEGRREETERYWIRTLTPCHNKAWNPCPDPDYPGWGADPNAEGQSITFRIADGELLAALDNFMASCRVAPRTSKVMTMALQKFLKAEGFYPTRGR